MSDGPDFLTVQFFFRAGIFNPHMAPPTVTGMSVQFQPIQTQVVENPQIIDQTSQSNFQTQIQHINPTIQQPMQQQMQQMQQIQSMQSMQPPVQMQQQMQTQLQHTVTDNQQNLTMQKFSMQNLSFQQQVITSSDDMDATFSSNDITQFDRIINLIFIAFFFQTN